MESKGKRSVGRPKTTRQRTVEGELKDLKMTCGEYENKAKYRVSGEFLC